MLDGTRRFLMLLAQPDTTRIVPFDFMPFLEELLAFHPGLAFLESTPEFQEKYARTVIARIMYQLDPLARGFIDGRSLRKSNLIQAFHTVDMEEDINLVSSCAPGSMMPRA
jgi:serine/threonine-protein phosphatase 2A regulatory subunit B''